ncbi:hypothetical protein [Candidatus Thiodiazotropha sp. CDECU1]|uniref:hypothetical protein n=1 Tax=Candidatus Thiodiazotropha sp. CDECU1 TaxID=3065865 RepID=UPI00292CB0B8|nr:hypothetical protein [Candidatus Thiodiazotropha sp. CDECU1]
MRLPTLSLKTLFIVSIIGLTASCSSDENNNKPMKTDPGVFQGYKDTLDKAQGVEQTLLQADKARREELQRQQ